LEAGRGDIVSMDTLREDVMSILKEEGLRVCYAPVESKPGEVAEGEYRPATKTVTIDLDLLGYPDEPLTLAHEIGHHFDLLKDGDLSIPTDERERRADEYMVRLATKHDLGDRARRMANYHRPGSYPDR
jgi:hypothetical protein